MRSVLSSAPLYLVDFLFYFEGLEVVELWLMGLELGVELVFACFLLLLVSGTSTPKGISFTSLPIQVTNCFVSLKEYHPAPFVTGR